MATCKDGCLSAKYDFGENNFFNNLKLSWLFYTFCALNLTGKLLFKSTYLEINF